jgi:hypothetical protein
MYTEMIINHCFVQKSISLNIRTLYHRIYMNYLTQMARTTI